MSKRRGGIPSPMRQVSQAYEAIAAHGESRHTAKHQLGGSEERIYAYGTRAKYTQHAVAAAKYIRSEFRIAKIGDWRQEHVKAYLDHKAKSGDWGADTFKTARAALNKIAYGASSKGWGLHEYSRSDNPLVPRDYQWGGRESNESSRQQIQPFGPNAGREFLSHLKTRLDSSKAHNVNRSGVMTGITIIRETGMRPGLDRIIGMRTENEQFVLEVKGKGGKERDVTMIRADYIPTLVRAYESARANGYDRPTVSQMAGVSDRTLQRWVERGIKKFDTRDKCINGDSGIGNGPHGLRGSWAQEKYLKLLDRGVPVSQAKLTVSRQLGHNRLDVLITYGIV